MNINLFKYIVILIFILAASPLFSNDTISKPKEKKILFNENKSYKIYKFSIKEMIAPPIWRTTKKAFEEAKELKADIILIQMNTYGGMLESADSMRTIIMQSKIPVFVFIDNNAASAGALISIACDNIYMRKGANIGAATVVNEKGEKLPDKYQSYMRSMMRSTAEAKGRDPMIAEAMVDPTVKVEGVTEAGKVVTFTTSEAIKHNYCDGEAENIEDIMKLAEIKNYQIITQKLTFLDNIIGFLVNPVVSGILIMIIVAGIYFEFQTPGAIFPIVIAACAALLYFAPLYLEGLTLNWEIVVFIIGVILLGIEVFVIPGFGVAGVLGITLIISGLTLGLVNNIGFDFSFVPGIKFALSLSMVIISVFLSIILSFMLSQKLFSTSFFGKSLALFTIQESNKGYTVAEDKMSVLVGKTGIAFTILRPVGKVRIDNDVYFATAETGYIDKGEKIRVLRYENAQIIVEKEY
ncbi:MAG: nodulation protein NfeD [Bacteroidales bacterium]|nr:nodulation protein NfeD [Bacteroidales bacterium]